MKQFEYGTVTGYPTKPASGIDFKHRQNKELFWTTDRGANCMTWSEKEIHTDSQMDHLTL